MAKIVQTAGRNALGEFAPDFARYNDDILFGEIWNDTALTPKQRSMIVISIFMGRGLCDSSLDHHLGFAKENGVTKEEISALITKGAFYAGWPVAWAVFNRAKVVWADAKNSADSTIECPHITQTAGRNALGEFAPDFARYNDDILFGEIWNDTALPPKQRSMIVISIFMGRGLCDSSLDHHLGFAKENGVTKEEISSLITQGAFYAGWPVAWAVFNRAKAVWAE